MRKAEITKNLTLEEQKRKLTEAAADKVATKALKNENDSKRNLLQLNASRAKQIIAADRVKEVI